MNAKFLGLAASLVLLGAAPVKATTYQFDTIVSGPFAAAGSVDLTVNGSNATFTVSLPNDYSFSVFALNLSSGAMVTPSSGYTIYTNANANFNKGATWPNYGPFNTVLTGNFGNSLTFTVADFAGIFNITVGEAPFWFVASYVNVGGSLGVMASDAISTPLPAALPLFASGLGALGLLHYRRKSKPTASSS